MIAAKPGLARTTAGIDPPAEPLNHLETIDRPRVDRSRLRAERRPSFHARAAEHATIARMDALDLDVRRHVYFSIVASGRPPTTTTAATSLGAEEGVIEGAYRRLHDAHALVLLPGTTDIWMANPFCFAPTPHRVLAGGREWTGTCCWDSLGIPAALHGDGRIDTACACCGEPLELVVRGGEVEEGADVLCHVLVPARRWWDDIGFT